MYSKTYRHKNCPMAVNPGGATTWELYDPKYIKQMASKAPLVNDLFPVYYTKGGVALWKYKSDQLCHEGTRFPMSLLSKLEQRSAQENEYKRQKALVTHCEAYNEKRGGFMPKRTPTGYKTVFHKISGLSRAPSVGVMCDNYNERTGDDQEWLVKQVNSVVSQVIIIDWTFEDAKHIRIDGHKIAGCILNVQSGDGRLMLTIFQATPSLEDAKLELAALCQRCIEAGVPVRLIVGDDEKYENALLEIFHTANPEIRVCTANPEGGGCGWRLGFLHALVRLRMTLDLTNVQCGPILRDASHALKCMDTKSEDAYIQHLSRMGVEPTEISQMTDGEKRSNSAIMLKYRTISDQLHLWCQIYDNHKCATDGEGNSAMTMGPGGTKQSLDRTAELIAQGKLQHGIGIPTHLDRNTDPTKPSDFRALDAESTIEGQHGHTHRILRDSSSFGPEHGGNKLLRHYADWNINTDVRNGVSNDSTQSFHSTIIHSAINHSAINHSATIHPLSNHSLSNHSLDNYSLSNHPLSNHPLSNHSLSNHSLSNYSLSNHSSTQQSFIQQSFHAAIIHSAIIHSAITHPAIIHSAIVHSAIVHSAVSNHSFSNHSLSIIHSATIHSATMHPLSNHSLNNYSLNNHSLNKIIHSTISHSAISHSAISHILHLRCISALSKSFCSCSSCLTSGPHQGYDLWRRSMVFAFVLVSL